MQTQYVVAAVVGAMIGVLVFWLFNRLLSKSSSAFDLPGAVGSSEAERQFRNVFAIMSDDSRQSLLSYYMRKHSCERQDAMRIAVEDKQREGARW